MDLRKIKKLIELLNESGVGEIEITEGEDSVRISRESSAKKMVTKDEEPQSFYDDDLYQPGGQSCRTVAPRFTGWSD